METVGVIGLGTMGAGIAEVFAKAGLHVIGVDIDDAAVERGRGHLAKSLDRQVAKGRLDADTRTAIDTRLTLTTDFEGLATTRLVVEAVPELLDIKRATFTRLDQHCGADTILATNTSSLSIAEIAGFTSRPAKVIGMHFFNPAPIMKLVEVVRGADTDPEVVAYVEELSRRLGKTPVTVADRPGFVVNRLLVGYLNQAAKLLDSQSAGRDEVDAAIKAAGLPMGPFMLMDVVGLDTLVEILDVIHADSGSPRHEAAGSLRSLVADGKLGRKSGAGFYDHSQSVAEAEVAADRVAELQRELILPHIGEAQEMADSGYASESDIDTAMKLGCGYPDGVFGLLRS
ncbi:3-hydroxyacyl-CoA dehydrogenase [Stackebrandtia nassauensis]|uniref:3-hydroxyacyl-CoA dehydrogenase n=1 Tax=Stackebrandtia nassauensis (strain DSM 44728 / CIP 108903 / NRRL B-16338 / NBRC 102104 / LLR-40K-21) TaxID=446470 RepID=D3PWE8_STANL|nr:3-hydroxyacyl-CoA dehydrogenase [Stackebrandtia nassauensis]ADD41305.1 3-hydroxyacyl-CoA dehydrogenase [Stackebrandtia nassauensis DSM 44728]